MLLEIYQKILITSFYGSIIALLIFLIKHYYQKKLSPNWHYYLWFLLIIKLLIPFEFETSFTFENLFSKLTHKNQLTINSHLYSETPTLSAESKKLQTSESKPSNLLLNNIPQNQLLLPSIWLLGAVCCFIYFFYSYLKFSIRIKQKKQPINYQTADLLKECQQLTNINHSIPLYTFSEMKIPCLWGFFRPKILLSYEISNNLSFEQQKHILIHELSHYRRKDHLINLIVILIKVCYWFNPLFWYAFYRMQQDCEIACDTYALSYLTSEERPSYARTILNLLSYINQPRQTLATLSLINQRKGIETRLRTILDFQKPNFKNVILGLIIITSLSLVSFTNACGITKTLFNQAQNKPLSSWPLPGHTEIFKLFNLEPITLSAHTLEKIDALKEISSIKELSSLIDFEQLKKTTWGTNPGIDIKAPRGSKILAAADGIVLDTGYHHDFGYYVILQHSNNFTTFYAHCQKILVKPNEKVHTRELIATSGDTGSTGYPSLHFELRQNGLPQNPLEYMEYNL